MFEDFGEEKNSEQKMKMVKFNTRDMPFLVCRDPPYQTTTKYRRLRVSPCYQDVFILCGFVCCADKTIVLVLIETCFLYCVDYALLAG
jgi:hypothetical protein